MASAFWEIMFKYSYQCTGSKASLNQATWPNSLVLMPITVA